VDRLAGHKHKWKVHQMMSSLLQTDGKPDKIYKVCEICLQADWMIPTAQDIIDFKEMHKEGWKLKEILDKKKILDKNSKSIKRVTILKLKTEKK